MPVVMTLGAVGVVAILLVIGWRHRWDPTPAPLPPVTLRSAREVMASEPLPRWYVPVALASFLLVMLGSLLSFVLDRPWLAVAGYVMFGAAWAARQAAIILTSAKTRLQRVVAVVRPTSLFAGVVASAITRSIWWIIGGAALYLAILPVTEAIERRRGRAATQANTDPSGPPRSG